METIKSVAEVMMIPLHLIDESPTNPASRLRDIDILAKSIQAEGRILEPLKVHRLEVSGRFEVDDGHRRRAAAIKLKHIEVPCIISERPKHPALVQLVTGLTQERLSPWETAKLIGVCLQEKMKQKEIGAAIGRSEGFMSKFKTINTAAAKLDTSKSGDPAVSGRKFSEFTSYEELYNECQAVLHPSRAAAKKAPASSKKQQGDRVELADDQDKEARTKLAAEIAERFKLPADNVDVVNEKDGYVAVVIAFNSLASAKKAFK